MMLFHGYYVFDKYYVITANKGKTVMSVKRKIRSGRQKVVISHKPPPQQRGRKEPKPMSRIPPPRAHIAQGISDFFANGINEFNDVKTTLFRLGAQRLIQELLEQEVTDFIGRDYYQSTRDIEENFTDEDGCCLISRTAVSESAWPKWSPGTFWPSAMVLCGCWRSYALPIPAAPVPAVRGI